MDSNQYTPEERAEMLARMKAASNVFYGMAVHTGCHTFIEFTGLMNEFINICEKAHEQGIDFPFANTHTGQALPMEPHHLAYLGEKLGCIYGPALRERSNLNALLSALAE